MTPRRTRTPSDVKWLANELAATTGELERIDQALARLHTRRARLQVVRAALAAVAGQMAVPELPTLVPSVDPHDRWGGRGRLREFIREALRRAHPLGVSTSDLTDLVVTAFGIQLANAAERKRLMDNSVRNALTKLRGQGEVEPLHSYQGVASYSGVWRWRVEAPTLDELWDAAGETAGVQAAAVEGRGNRPWR